MCNLESGCSYLEGNTLIRNSRDGAESCDGCVYMDFESVLNIPRLTRPRHDICAWYARVSVYICSRHLRLPSICADVAYIARLSELLASLSPERRPLFWIPNQPFSTPRVISIRGHRLLVLSLSLSLSVSPLFDLTANATLYCCCCCCCYFCYCCAVNHTTTSILVHERESPSILAMYAFATEDEL